MTEKPEDVVQEIRNRLNASIMTLSLATSGLGLMHTKWSEIRSTQTPIPENPDPMVFVGEGHPNDPTTRPHAALPISLLLDLTRRDGEAAVLLSQQWLVAWYQEWEDDLRPRLATARSVPTNEVKEPVFGDLRLMRHDVIHKNGIATLENTGKCEELHWFAVGERISPSAEHLAELQEALGNTFRL